MHIWRHSRTFVVREAPQPPRRCGGFTLRALATVIQSNDSLPILYPNALNSTGGRRAGHCIGTNVTDRRFLSDLRAIGAFRTLNATPLPLPQGSGGKRSAGRNRFIAPGFFIAPSFDKGGWNRTSRFPAVKLGISLCSYRFTGNCSPHLRERLLDAKSFERCGFYCVYY